jgi:DNA polymerase-3 subunit delta
VEGPVSTTSAAFKTFAAVAQTVAFDTLKVKELPAWVADAAAARRLQMDGGAAAALAALVGPDLWTVENELEKLEAYAGGEPIDRAMVERLVSSAQEARSWDVTDPLIAGEERRALAALQRMLSEGEPPARLAVMVGRAYRQLALIKEVLDRRAPKAEVERLLGNQAFKADTLSRLASRYSWEQIRAAFRLIVDADLSVKRGLQDDESALQLLVHELAALAGAPRSGGSARSGGYARSAGSRSG